MKIGDLVPIYYVEDYGNGPVNTMGVITEIVGYKTKVLVNGKLVPWDIFDLETMKRRKEQHASW